MKLSLVKTAVTSKVGRQILLSQKHSPTILFGVGVVGVVASTVMACRATLKLEEVLREGERDLAVADNLADKNDDRYTEKDHKHDVRVIRMRAVGQVCKLYGPPAAVGVLSLAALSGSHVILSRRNVALTAAYAAVERSFRDYRERVVEQMGPDKDRELLFGVTTREVVEETKNGPKVSTIPVPKGPSMYARVFGRQTSSSWEPHPAYNITFLQCQQEYANQKLQARGHVLLNDVYDALGLERTKAGCVVGWVKGHGDNFVDFGIFQGGVADQLVEFMSNGREGDLLLDFNVDGVVYDLIEKGQ